jgi:hypothetical protein
MFAVVGSSGSSWESGEGEAMTEVDWNISADPEAMLRFLWSCRKPSDRKVRLFMVACCRQAWQLFTDEHTRRAIAVAEWDVDGLTNKEVFRVAARGVAGADRIGRLHPLDVASLRAAWVALTGGRDTPSPSGVTAPNPLAAVSSAADLLAFVSPSPEQVRRSHAALLRDIFGPLLFRPLPPIAHEVLTWNAGTVKRLAEGVYQERRLPQGTFDTHRLVVLADALEEAGCDDADLLEHLRGGIPHVRGCHAVDLLLNKG